MTKPLQRWRYHGRHRLPAGNPPAGTVSADGNHISFTPAGQESRICFWEHLGDGRRRWIP